MYRFPFLNYSLQYLYSYRGVGDNISLVWLSSGTISPLLSERRTLDV